MFSRWTSLLLLALVCACSRGSGCAERPRDAGPQPQAPAAADQSKTSLPPQLTPIVQPGAETRGTVVRVRDGDSIVVKRGDQEIEVRLDGIDCPELDQSFGKEAKQFTSDLVMGTPVRLISKGKDQYDRELAQVFLVDRRSLNRELVATGHAWWFTRYSKDRTLEFLEKLARKERRGLWAEPNPVPPWDYREKGKNPARNRTP